MFVLFDNDDDDDDDDDASATAAKIVYQVKTSSSVRSQFRQLS